MAYSASNLRSDSLSTLRPLTGPDGILQMFDGIFQVTLIVDANIILGEIRWLTVKRKRPNARSDLKELLDAKTVLAIAPTFLKKEMDINLSKMATENKVDIAVFEAHWNLLQSLIFFIDVGGPDSTFKDPKDAPYIKLQRLSGHLIYSRDNDILNMGGKIATSKMVASLRTYSRNAVIEYTLKAGGVGTFSLSFSLIVAIFKFSRNAIPRAKRIPRKIWLTAAILIAAALIYKPSRIYLKNLLELLSSRANILGKELITQFELSFQEHEDAKRNANEALRCAQENNILKS